MTADIITPGHIKCIEELRKDGFVIVGLLSDDALKGYKKTVTPYTDRKYIMETIAKAIGNTMVVKQDTLDPIYNIEFYECKAIASGDGWEESELKTIDKLGLEAIDVKLKSEKVKRYSSTKIRERIIKQKRGSD